MTPLQKTIKYIATGFAALLAVSIIVSILQFALLAIGALTGKKVKTIDSTQVFEAQKVESIKVTSNIGDINFVDTSEDKITIKAEDVPESYTCELDSNGTIKIINKNKKTLLHNFFKSSSTITIYVPSDKELNVVSVKTGVGDLSIDNCKINSFTSDNGVGDLNIENSSINTVDIDSGIGDCEISINGDIEDYNITIDSGIGDHEINGKSSKKYSGSNGSNKFVVDSGIGDCEIDIKN